MSEILAEMVFELYRVKVRAKNVVRVITLLHSTYLRGADNLL